VIPLRDNIPTRSTPVVTILLILANVVVFLIQQATPVAFTYTFAMIPAEVWHPGSTHYSEVNFHPAWVALFTSMFLHGGWMHLIGNMLYLWIFGNNVEDSLGRARYLTFYFICGIAAGLTHLLVNAGSAAPTLGASGAIAGVLGGYLLLFPRARVLTLVPIFFFLTTYEIPASVVLGFWFLLQLFNAIMGSGMVVSGRGNPSGGVAVWAHVGGFVCGYLLIRLMGAERRDPPPRARPSFMDY
jgi:membrane associated rhomboid family serine protease